MNAEKLAYWFFRLNGCFTFENFIVHLDLRGPQQTDADLIALRFQHRRELHTSGNPMKDHPLFADQPKVINAYLVEAKQGVCALNGPWTDPQRQNLQRVLFAMGFLPEEEVDNAAIQLYERLCYSDDLLSIRFVAVGRQRNERGAAATALQLTWEEMLTWIHARFKDYARQKADHSQWDISGKRLFQSAVRNFRNDEAGFVAHWLQAIAVLSLSRNHE